MVKPEQFLDKYTRIDNVLVNILEHMQQVQAMQQDRELKVIYFAYPWDGTLQTLEAGTTTLDFGTGTITDVNGTPSKMRHSLDSEGKDWLRSFFVNSDKFIIAQPDNYDKIPGDEEKDIVGIYQQFRRLKITCEEQTKVFVLCCTSPDAVVKLISNAVVLQGATNIFGDRTYIDNSEIAARLGSINTYERRGNIIMQDNFEAPTFKWEATLSGVGAAVIRSIASSFCENYSMKVITGDGSGDTTYATRKLHIPPLGIFGAEYSFTVGDKIARISNILRAYLGEFEDYYQMQCAFYPQTHCLNIYTGAGAWTNLTSTLYLREDDMLYHTWKLVGDFSTGYYKRLYLNDTEYDISDYQMYTISASGQIPSLYEIIEVMNYTTASNHYCYFDNVIITQNEPL